MTIAPYRGTCRECGATDEMRAIPSVYNIRPAVRDVILERDRQDQKWGGPRHDDRHSVMDFVRYIRNYAGWAEQMADGNSLLKARRRLVQVAALAVAAVEMIDRRLSREGRR